LKQFLEYRKLNKENGLFDIYNKATLVDIVHVRTSRNRKIVSIQR